MSTDSYDPELGVVLRKMDQATSALERYMFKRERGMLPRRRSSHPLPLASPAWMLDITRQPDGSFWVRIDEKHEFRLTRKLGLLLGLLAADKGRCEQGIVEWKPTAELQAAMGDPGVPVARHTLVQSLSLLRKELLLRKLDGMLARDEEKDAYRFLLRAA